MVEACPSWVAWEEGAFDLVGLTLGRGEGAFGLGGAFVRGVGASDLGGWTLDQMNWTFGQGEGAIDLGEGA